jgi:hypothetical protein
VQEQVLSNSASVKSNTGRSEHSRMRIRSGWGLREEIRRPHGTHLLLVTTCLLWTG